MFFEKLYMNDVIVSEYNYFKNLRDFKKIHGIVRGISELNVTLKSLSVSRGLIALKSSIVLRMVSPPNPVAWQKAAYRGTIAYPAPTTPTTRALRYKAVFLLDD